jgi:hypothetical protein
MAEPGTAVCSTTPPLGVGEASAVATWSLNQA